MRRVILYIAASLDGYIAGENGGVDWLDREAAPDEAGNGYEAFLREIDTIVMGYNTYRQVTEELSGKMGVSGKKGAEYEPLSVDVNLSNTYCFACTSFSYVLLRLTSTDSGSYSAPFSGIHPFSRREFLRDLPVSICPLAMVSISRRKASYPFPASSGAASRSSQSTPPFSPAIS